MSVRQLDDLLVELEALLRKRALLRSDQPFTLASGKSSTFFIDGTRASLWPRGKQLIGETVFRLVRDMHVDAVGGIAQGAVPIADAVSFFSALEGEPIPAFIVRDERKEHGTKDLIIDPHDDQGTPVLTSGKRVVIVDDVITTGSSIRRAIQAVEEIGCCVAGVVVLVDRKEKESEELKSRYPFTALFSTDFDGNLHIEIDPSLRNRTRAIAAV